MSTFYYKALDGNAQEVSGEMEADSSASVSKSLREASFFPTEILDEKAYRARTAQPKPDRPVVAPKLIAAARTPLRFPPQRTLSGLLIVLGSIIAGYFFFVYDTTVETKSDYIPGYGSVGGERVHNEGLMQNRFLGSIGGSALVVIGVILLVTSPKPSVSA